MKNIDELLDKTKKKKMLLVFPHPDDETVWASGLIQRAVSRGWRVKVLCLTMGERGQVHVKPNGRSLSQIRREEMARAMEVLGAEFEMWDFGDGRLKVGRKWRSKLEESLKIEDPGLVVTYDHSGISGHPDHIVVSIEVLEVVRQLNKVKLLWVTADGRVRDYLQAKIKTFEYLSQPGLELRLTVGEWWGKQRALWSHRSQPLKSVKRMFLRHWKEHFAVVDVNRKYEYKYVPFEI